ncbi:MAG: hypothetical protein PVG27_13245 [Chloroflexota bacterium]|jgi:hypothetical protein
MSTRTGILRTGIALVVSMIVISALPAGALAHLGEDGHLHVPGNATTPASSVWCVSFTQDPGVWRPEGATAVEASTLDSVIIVFEDCAEVLGGYYAIESHDGGLSRTEVGDSVVAARDTPDAATTGEEVVPAYIGVKAWAKHQKQWLAKGDKLVAKIGNVRTPAQARKALGAFQRHLRDEIAWLRKNASRFEPDSCLADDKRNWQNRVKQANTSLNKAVTAMKRGNAPAMNTQLRQFARAWTKVEQVYNVGMCDF